VAFRRGSFGDGVNARDGGILIDVHWDGVNARASGAMIDVHGNEILACSGGLFPLDGCLVRRPKSNAANDDALTLCLVNLMTINER
jgi:hypothetical protein